MTAPLAVGAEAAARRFGPLTRIDIARFAGAGGDFNPLHLDPDAAREAGFDDVIAMGQLQAGVLAGTVSDWVGVERVQRLDVRFRSPFRLGDELVVTARVVSVEPSAASGSGTAVVEATGAVGERIVITASVRVAL